MGIIITFYSYKGGVGRTMALANVATLLSSWNNRVLIIDWDLDAPGLEFYFSEFIDLEEANKKPGIIDLLNQDTATNSNYSLSWEKALIEIQLPNSQTPLHMISAGRRDELYFDRVRKFDTQEFYSNKGGGQIIEQFRKEWSKNYDFILIDSRTGITEIGGICTVQLPDILVLLFTANEQSLNGIINVAKKANLARYELPFDRYSLISIPIPSRFDSNEEFKESQYWLNRFSEDLAPIYDDWLPKSISKRAFLEMTKIPYIAYFSFGEKLPVLEQGTTDPQGLGYAYETLAALIANRLESIEMLEKSRIDFVHSIARLYKNARNNPFIYSHPVSGTDFIGRNKVLKRITRSIITGQSVAIIGDRRIGKTSLLQHLAQSGMITNIIGKGSQDKLLVSYIDGQVLAGEDSPVSFWELVFRPLVDHNVIFHPELKKAYIQAKSNKFDIRIVKKIVRLFSNSNYRLVLLIDEFSTLLHSPVFASNSFMSSLRSIISQSRALNIIFASHIMHPNNWTKS